MSAHLPQTSVLVICGLIFALGACGEAATSGGEDGTADCATLSPGPERDRCLHEEIKTLPPSEASAVLEKAQQIQDEMIRGAAVSGWVAEHNADVPQQQGNALCQLLDGRDKAYCQRRLSSPHLQR